MGAEENASGREIFSRNSTRPLRIAYNMLLNSHNCSYCLLIDQRPRRLSESAPLTARAGAGQAPGPLIDQTTARNTI